MSNDSIMSKEDAELLSRLVNASESTTKAQERILLATMAATIASGTMPESNPHLTSVEALHGRARVSVQLARLILEELVGP